MKIIQQKKYLIVLTSMFPLNRTQTRIRKFSLARGQTLSSNNIIADNNYSHSIDWIFEKVVWWHSCLQRFFFVATIIWCTNTVIRTALIFKLRECNFRLECHRNSHSANITIVLSPLKWLQDKLILLRLWRLFVVTANYSFFGILRFFTPSL